MPVDKYRLPVARTMDEAPANGVRYSDLHRRMVAEMVAAVGDPDAPTGLLGEMIRLEITARGYRAGWIAGGAAATIAAAVESACRELGIP